MGHSDSGSGSDDEKKHSKKDKHEKKDKHDKEGKHKEDKHKDDKHSHESLSHDVIPGHEQYGGKLKKEDIQNLKHRTDISDGERDHRRKIMMAELAGGVVGAGVLGFAGYEAFQHFGHKDGEGEAHSQHKDV